MTPTGTSAPTRSGFKQRWVRKTVNPDGTAELHGTDLPFDITERAWANLTRLARLAKNAGVPGNLGTIRADLYTLYLTGAYQHATDDDIINDLLARATDPNGPGHPDDDPTPDPEAQLQRKREADHNRIFESDLAPTHHPTPYDLIPDPPPPTNHTPKPPAPTDHVPEPPAPTEDPTPTPNPPPPARTAAPGSPDDSDGLVDSDDSVGGDVVGVGVGGSGGSDGPVVPRPPTGAAVRPLAGFEVRVRLSTLIGLDDHPGEVAGSGPVHAFLARGIVTDQARGRWRFAVTDDHGCLTEEGVLRARPTGILDTAPPVTGAIVEIAVPRTLLDQLRTDPAKAKTWAPVVSDIHRQTRKHRTSKNDPQPGPQTDPRRRTPGAGLRRHVEIRDRGCVAPGCRMPATSCDLDHRIDHAKGGSTIAQNLQPLCRHDHRLKHDGGWAITRLPDGAYRWRTPNGLTFDTRPPPIIIDLPPPRPRE